MQLGEKRVHFANPLSFNRSINHCRENSQGRIARGGFQTTVWQLVRYARHVTREAARVWRVPAAKFSSRVRAAQRGTGAYEIRFHGIILSSGWAIDYEFRCCFTLTIFTLIILTALVKTEGWSHKIFLCARKPRTRAGRARARVSAGRVEIFIKLLRACARVRANFFYPERFARAK